MNLAIDLAIFERLTGAPLDSKGYPQLDKNRIPTNRSVIGPPNSLGPDALKAETDEGADLIANLFPSYGIRIPVQKKGQEISGGLSTQNPQALKLFEDGWKNHAFRQVPIFNRNIEGRKFEDVWPCIVFYWSDMDFDESTFVFDDPFCGPTADSAEQQVQQPDGTIVTGNAPLTQWRSHPDPWSPQYTIRTYSKNLFETLWMVRGIQQLFRPRGGLIVKQADGTDLVVDMLYDSFQNMDVGTYDLASSESPKEQSYYSRAFTYTIEGYLDNTIPEGSENGFGLNPGDSWITQDTIRQRCLELANIRDEVLETTTFDEVLDTP